MTDPDTLARNRYFAITAVRIAGALGAVLGLILIARSPGLEGKILGTAIVLAAMFFIATVPLSLARRWRSPPGE